MSSAPARLGWLRGMCLYTALGAGVAGLIVLLTPRWLVMQLQMPGYDEVVLGIVGSCYVAFGAIAWAYANRCGACPSCSCR